MNEIQQLQLGEFAIEGVRLIRFLAEVADSVTRQIQALRDKTDFEDAFKFQAQSVEKCTQREQTVIFM